MPDASRVPFVGRGAELRLLEEAHQAAAAGEPRVVLVTGETGIGKSRLLAEFLRSRAARASLLAACPPVSGSCLPYAPVVSILRTLRQHLEPGAFDEMVEPRSALRALLPDAPPDPEPPGDPMAQLRLFEQFVSMLLRHAAEVTTEHGPLVVAIEDVHWADPASADLLAYLVANVRAAPLLLVVTYRSTDARPDTALGRALAELVRQPVALRLELERLTDDDALRLLAARDGAGEVSVDVVRRSGGNPLFLLELATADGGRPPRTLHDLLVARVEALPEPARRLLELAAVAGVSVPTRFLDEASRLAGLDPAEPFVTLRAAGHLELASVDGEESYAFARPVVREVVQGAIAPSVRRRLHGLLAQAHADGAAAGERRAILDRARHLAEAGADGDDTFDALLAAAELSERLLAFADAHALYERVLAVAPRRSGADLRLRAAQAASLAGAPWRAVEIVGELRRAGHLSPSGEARHAQYLWEAGRRRDALAAYRALVDVLDPDDPARGAVLTAAARAHLAGDEAAEARRLAEQALAVPSDPRGRLAADAGLVLAAALAQLGDGTAALGALEGSRRAEERRRRLSGEIPRPSRIVDLLSGYWSRALALEGAGRHASAADVALAAVQRAAELGVRHEVADRAAVVAVSDLIELGRWNEAAETLDRLGDGLGLTATALLAGARLATWRGDFGTAVERLAAARRARDADDEQLSARGATVAAELALWTGQVGEAYEAVADALANVPLDGPPRVSAELTALALRAAADRADLARARAASAELAAIEHEAATLLGRALPLVAQSGDPVIPLFVEQAQAERLRVAGEAAPGKWSAVADGWTTVGLRWRAAYARWRAAEAAAGGRSRRALARELMRQAEDEAAALGAEPLRRELERLAQSSRLAGPRAAPVEVGRRGGADVNRLTRREREVLVQLTAGRSDREIGAALDIAPRTAGSHVSSILAKLGVGSRVQAATIGVRAGMVPAAASPGIAVTTALMFTDIVKSTALLEAIGDRAWLDLVRWHDAKLRSLFAAHGGHEIDHAGDGFFVAFDEFEAALDCAVAVQRALAEHRRQHGFAPQVRIGLHTASVSRQGDALRGIGVHRAARIAAAAGADEIVVSREALTEHDGRHARGAERTVRLRGLAQPVTLVTIDWRRSAGER